MKGERLREGIGGRREEGEVWIEKGKGGPGGRTEGNKGRVVRGDEEEEAKGVDEDEGRKGE